jgi:oxygen-independent coproporphyrinogen-3 oxidase
MKDRSPFDKLAANGSVRVEPVETRTEDAVALYVHWPFCLAKCPYCDFNSHVRDAVDQSRWRSALLAELDHYADQTSGRRLTSIFFGGGTPSLMAPETVGEIIARACARWRAADDLEVTLEANPTSVEAAKFAAYCAAGVNRISLGVQALDDSALAFLGRRHGAAEARAAVALAQRFAPRVSFDLIYARPGQSVADWEGELRDAIGIGTEHLSLYQLTLEKGTPFYGAALRGAFTLPDEDTQAALFEATQEVCAAAGLPDYEISNHARPGAECRHNLTYWESGDYMGIGPGAHGRITVDGAAVATEQSRAPEAWLAAVERQGHATQARVPIAPAERATEVLMMGLRLARGMTRAQFRRRTGLEPRDFLDAAAVERLTRLGLLVAEGERLCATPAGRQRLNAVLSELVP